jgi:hypothetical protein
MGETREQLRARLQTASDRWQCLIENAEEIAVAQRSLNYGQVQKILKKCNVPDEDIPYYMSTIMECVKGKSW